MPGKKAKALFAPKLAKAKLVLAAGGRPSKAQKSTLRKQAARLSKAAGTPTRKKRKKR